jgi:putative transposase
MAYKCRAYPDAEQVSVLNRTFGCVRYVWNRTLAWRHARYHGEQVKTNFTQANAYLTAMKATEDLAWLNEVSSVPLQQAIRHQQVAYTSFFAKRARYPRYKSRTGRQSAEYTRSGFRYRDGQLFLAKMDTPLVFVWSWPDIDPAGIDRPRSLSPGTRADAGTSPSPSRWPTRSNSPRRATLSVWIWGSRTSP